MINDINRCTGSCLKDGPFYSMTQQINSFSPWLQKCIIATHISLINNGTSDSEIVENSIERQWSTALQSSLIFTAAEKANWKLSNYSNYAQWWFFLQCHLSKQRYVQLLSSRLRTAALWDLYLTISVLRVEKHFLRVSTCLGSKCLIRHCVLNWVCIVEATAVISRP